MRGLVGLIGSSLGGGIGWWLGARVGIMTAVMLCIVGSGVGLYAAKRMLDEYLP